MANHTPAISYLSIYIIETAWYYNGARKQQIQSYIAKYLDQTLKIPLDIDFSAITVELLLEYSSLSKTTQGNS